MTEPTTDHEQLPDFCGRCGDPWKPKHICDARKLPPTTDELIAELCRNQCELEICQIHGGKLFRVVRVARNGTALIAERSTLHEALSALLLERVKEQSE